MWRVLAGKCFAVVGWFSGIAGGGWIGIAGVGRTGSGAATLWRVLAGKYVDVVGWSAV